MIDNIFSNDLDNHKFSGILWSDISVHLPIFQITNCSLKPKIESSVYHKRLITTHNIENLRPHLCSINWDFSQSSSSNAVYNSFMDCLYPIYETCFPVKIITVKENSKAKLGLPQGSKIPVVGSTLSINNNVIILHQLTKLYIPNFVTNTTI